MMTASERTADKNLPRASERGEKEGERGEERGKRGLLREWPQKSIAIITIITSEKRQWSFALKGVHC